MALAVAAGPACRSEVLLGEQDLVAPSDADLDAEVDAEPDSDPEAAADAEADADAPLTCVEAMVCVAGCGEDALCALGCGERICPNAAEVFVSLRDCALPACAADCADFGSSACQSCVGARCPLFAFQCLDATC